MRPDTPVPKRHGGNVRNARTTHPRRTARRERAAERAVVYSTRTNDQQLRKIAGRRGASAREFHRLTGQYLAAW